MATEHITRDMTVGDIVEKYPQVAEIFMEYGLHCVGCHVAAWETIEEGARGHGMDEEEIELMIQDANELVESTYQKDAEKKPDTVFVTQAAVQRVKDIAQKSKKDLYVFRIGVAQGGCSGFSYTFDIEDLPKSSDKSWEVGGVQIVMDFESFEKLKGCTVDYIDTLAQSGFKIHNPNASTTCGCGSSFA
ncbi:MAG: iron-sulfur cluster assembly accessory protein [Candidatus Woesearchaeota archaeon]